MSGRFQISVRWINTERNDVVRVLIRYKQERTCRIDYKVTRSLTKSRLVPQEFKLAALVVDPERCKVIIAAVGAVKKVSVGRNVNIRTGIFAFEVRGQRWQIL